MSLSQNIGTFVSELSGLTPPEGCFTAARLGMTDCVGVMLAGAGMEGPAIVAASVAETSGPSAPQIGSARRLSPRDAALVNGTAAHVLDFDDMAMDAHPSAVLTPAILAVGAAYDCSGEDAIRAYIAGYEVWALLQDISNRVHLQDRGLHPTGIFGPIAAAAACAYLRKLGPERTANAVGVAASFGGGIVANFGSMTKSLHSGWASQAGVVAADLAAGGFTASSDVLEHRLGFIHAYFPEIEQIDTSLAMPNGAWRLDRRGVNIKRYPVCYLMHRTIDSMIDLVTEAAIDPDSVREIRVNTGQTQLAVLRNHEPKTGLAAKFSMEFAMASALVARNVGLSQVADDFVARPDVAAAMGKVRPMAEAGSSRGPAAGDEISVVLNSGEIVNGRPIRFPKGSWKNRISEAEFEVKFLDCASQRNSGADAKSLFQKLIRLDAQKSLRDLQFTS
ncbi:MmgE/PrpD family protein [Chelativorans sp. AA-79]|uniref:MmgE/PrpD family protein n=1 Tax=Chelativorans sp. AA-79 TaxID=3028735 RepID=UPI0023F84937|nr:MmgE/PrpD family protein [Chelativorans sp. AA-79]WEX12471.1 MmgE/PrpD family protein [Chelativorans sp. AA-79]